MAIAWFRAQEGHLPAQRVAELEAQLFVAHASVVKFTASNTPRSARLEGAELRHRKLRQSANRDSRDFTNADTLRAAQTARRR